MSNYGIKVSEEGDDVTSTSLNKLLINSSIPFWKCDLRANPKHYGLLKIHYNLAVNEVKTIYSVDHGYDYMPGILVSWSYAPGTKPFYSFGNETYGIGTIEIWTNASNLYTISAGIDIKKFFIVMDGRYMTNPVIDGYVEIKYYIFAGDFIPYTHGNILLTNV